MITPMSLYAAALWGLIGAGAIEAWELYGAIHRLRGFPWDKPGEVAMAPFLVAVALRLLLGIGLATAFVASGQADGPVGAVAVGIAAPKLLEQLARHTIARATPGTAPARETAAATAGTRPASQLVAALARATPAFGPGGQRTLGDRPDPAPEPQPEESPSDRSFFPEATQDSGTWVVIDPHQPRPRRHQREPFRRRLAVVSAGFAVPLLLLAGVVIGRYAGIGSMAVAPASKPTPTARPTISPLVVALVVANKSGDAKGKLPPSTCKQDSSTRVTCTVPALGIAGVVFQTYPNQKALYTAYRAKVSSLDNGHFRQNFSDCESQVTYGEIGWNHLEYMVWTQNDGHLMGYVAGPMHADVWNWWVAVHHNIALGGAPTNQSLPAGTPGSASATRAEPR